MFTHLHLHTQYSLLDGACNIKQLMQKAKDNGMKAVAITDHGNMFGVKDFYNIAKANEIKPVIGCEVYMAQRSRFDKDSQDKGDRSGYHLILLAKSLAGYHNLVKLVSYSWIEGFYYKPRIDRELLEKYHDGLIALTACIAGEIPENILSGQIARAEETIQYFKSLFKDDFYLEIMRHKTGDPVMDNDVYFKQEKVIAQYIELSRKYTVKLVATNDVHFVNASDAKAHDILICLNTNSEIDDDARLRYTQQEYFKTQDEMAALFSDLPEAIDTTAEIEGKIEEYSLECDPVMPFFPIPEEFANDDEYLRHLTFEGAQQRYGVLTPQHQERLDFELGVIKKMGYSGYFLIVRDFLTSAREMGVWVGPGRGSAAGSVVAYCNYITDIDPLQYGLLFERFLNPDRISMPDIDIDFDEDGRDKVLEYVVNKYGQQKVAQIVTFGTMAAKMAIRDVARVLKLHLSESNRLAKMVPETPGITLKQAYEEVKELAVERNSANPLIADTLKYAETLEGSVRQTGIHACGVIIGRNDLINHIPLCKLKDSPLLVTQYEGDHMESVGMLKMDFLGLKTLSIIKDAVEFIRQGRSVEIDVWKLPLDDAKTYELYSRGDTTGIFQFESPGMRKYLRELKPNRFEDLIAMNALFRPGPMEYIPSYIRRKHGKEKLSYALPEMEAVLSETYGITVYQEQVMILSQVLAGFTAGQADSLRKAMGKKQFKVMEEMKEKFVEGCLKKGIDDKLIVKIWTDWEAFAQYAFNKSHSTCYAYLSYQAAYLKANYPVEFMAAVLCRNLNDLKKITNFMDECRRMNIAVLCPDINESSYRFTINKKGQIRFGMGAIKGIGEKAVEEIIKEREKNGPYKDIYDLVERVNLQAVNKKNLEAMAYAGALDNLPPARRYQYFISDEKNVSTIENLLRYGNKYQSEITTSKNNLFGDGQHTAIIKPEIPTGEEWSQIHLLNFEKEVIGIYLSSHPLDQYAFEMKQFCNTTLAGLHDPKAHNGRELCFAGMVTEANHAVTKTGKNYGSMRIEDYSESYRLMFFSKDYLDFNKFFIKGALLLIKGKFQQKTWQKENPEELEFKVKSITLLSEVRDQMIKKITITIPAQEVSETLINDFMQMTTNVSGNVLLRLVFFDQQGNVELGMFSRNKRIQLTDQFLAFLQNNPVLEYKFN